MNLQRISEFTEIQEGKASIFVKYLERPPSLHPEVFA